jgi:hypothetical protein
VASAPRQRNAVAGTFTGFDTEQRVFEGVVIGTFTRFHTRKWGFDRHLLKVLVDHDEPQKRLGDQTVLLVLMTKSPIFARLANILIQRLSTVANRDNGPDGRRGLFNGASSHVGYGRGQFSLVSDCSFGYIQLLPRSLHIYPGETGGDENYAAILFLSLSWQH